ncbi:MAG: hypothetical protein H0Z40_11950 [Desulfotomaculum sp.]|nr:hypothetical protein [Desulfotomaculum sp.]
MRINHNIAALNTYRQLTINNILQQKSLEKLSSGLRINKAADDAAGLAISEKMRAQIRGLEQAKRNAQDSISLLQTAEGGLNETHTILQRMRELAVQAANDTNTDDDRAEIQKEIEQLKEEINRIANTTEFNTKKLLNGSMGAKATITSGDEVTTAMVTGDITNTGTFDIDLTQVGVAHVVHTNAPTKDDGSGSSTSVTLDTTSTLDTLFKDATNNPTPFDGTQSLAITQGNQTMNITLNANDTLADIINRINQNAEDMNMNIIASWNSSAQKLEIASTETGLANQVTVNEVNFASNVTFGFAEKTTAKDYQFTVTNNTTGVQTTGLTSTTDTIEINDNGTGLTGVTVTFGSSAAGTKATINMTSGAIETQIGANENQTMEIDIRDMRALALGVNATGVDENGNTRISQFASLDVIDVSTGAKAQDAIITIDKAIKEVSAERSKLGSFQNRLEHTIANLGTSAENLTASESRIRDVDMAKEMMEFTKMNILSQAAQAMLAQANQIPQGVLQLLR